MSSVITSAARALPSLMPDERKAGAAIMPAALELFGQLGIRYLPASVYRYGAMETSCGPFLENLIENHGADHVRLVLRVITETDGPGNDRELNSHVIGAVSDLLLAHPRYANLGLTLFDAMDSISLAELRAAAKRSKVHPTRKAIAALLCARLEQAVGPPILPKPKAKRAPKVPASIARIGTIERNIALGRDLNALRQCTPANKLFSKLRTDKFPEVEPLFAAECMRVADVYGDRPDVYRKLFWKALIDLSSPRTPISVRQEIETRLAAGRKVTAPEIRKLRGACKTGAPRRKQQQPQSATINSRGFCNA